MDLQTAGRKQRIVYRAWWTYRLSVTIAAVAYLLQAVSAGQYLSGSAAFLRVHQQTPIVADMALFIGIISAIVLRWPGGVSARPLVVVIAIFLVAQAQAFAGSLRLMSWHVPLGVGLATLAVAIALHAWRHAAPLQKPSAMTR